MPNAPNEVRWVFRQLRGARGGPAKTLELADHAAPHGRPRKGEIFAGERTLRQSESYHAGNDEPTRHVFGKRLEPLLLKGRFSDIYGGNGFARRKAAEVTAFFDDQATVQVTWDTILQIKGIVSKFTPRWESGAECVWEMEVSVDEDLKQPVARVRQASPSPASFAQQIQTLLAKFGEELRNLEREPVTLKGDIIDSMASLVGSVNSVQAELNGVVDQIDSFASATLGQLRRLRLGLDGFRIAVFKLRNFYDNLRADIALEAQRTNEQMALWRNQAAWSTSSLEAIRLADEAHRATLLEERGRVLAFYTARQGDSWEAIARRHYGDPERADDIREANGVEGAEQPQAGTTYMVPR